MKSFIRRDKMSLKGIEILIKTRNQITDDHQFAPMYDEAIKELESLQDKLTKAQNYIKNLEEQLKAKDDNGWMRK
jgi:hypothetical protein